MECCGQKPEQGGEPEIERVAQIIQRSTQFARNLEEEKLAHMWISKADHG